MGLPVGNDLLAIISAQIMGLNQNFAHKETIVFKIWMYKYCVNKSGDYSRDHFAKNFK